MKINKTLLIITFLFFCKVAVGQERLTPLQYNPALVKHRQGTPAITTRSGVVDTTTIGLPFVDDFSYSQKYPATVKYPNPKLWADSEVYINNDYGVNPPSVGVATFDGLNKYGLPYSYTPFNWGGADTLTSRLFNFRDSVPGDSIYLSFFYQPQGLGDSALSYDSLVLEFRDNNGQWDEVWGDTGSSLRPFKQVILPVKDIKYFHPGFQFRFRNYAILSGNNNNWNLDYVKMDARRSYTDTIVHDVAFQYNSQSILKNYTQMPWVQFYNDQSKELRDSFDFYIINNFPPPDIENINVNNSAYNLNTGSIIYNTVTPPSYNINPNSSLNISFPTFSIPTNISYLNDVGDSVAAITVKTNIKALIPDVNHLNDTIYHDQYFYNYFAYDDGTAETAYSLLGDGATSPELALKFHLNRPDTLRALQIYFVLANSLDSNGIFVIQAWNSLFPENIVATDSLHYSNVTFVDSLTGFATYVFQYPYGADSGDIYVGFLQSDPNSLYIGYDVNDNDSMNLFYNVGEGFAGSQFHGTVMIRPVFGKFIGYSTGIVPQPGVIIGSIKVYPDPVNDLLHINIQSTTIKNGDLSIQNILGQTVINETSLVNLGAGATSTIDVSNLPAGMYFVRLTDKNTNSTLTTKFVKAN